MIDVTQSEIDKNEKTALINLYNILNKPQVSTNELAIYDRKVIDLLLDSVYMLMIAKGIKFIKEGE